MMYYAILTIIGNEIMPRNLSQDLYITIVTILGAMFMAFLFGSIAATVASMSSKKTYYSDQLENVSHNMKSIKLDAKQQEEVISYIELI